MSNKKLVVGTLKVWVAMTTLVFVLIFLTLYAFVGNDLLPYVLRVLSFSAALGLVFTISLGPP